MDQEFKLPDQPCCGNCGAWKQTQGLNGECHKLPPVPLFAGFQQMPQGKLAIGRPLPPQPIILAAFPAVPATALCRQWEQDTPAEPEIVPAHPPVSPEQLADMQARLEGGALREPAPEALCEDEGCPNHGEPHVCNPSPEVVAAVDRYERKLDALTAERPGINVADLTPEQQAAADEVHQEILHTVCPKCAAFGFLGKCDVCGYFDPLAKN